MSKRMDRSLVDGLTQLMTTNSLSAILVEEMGAKLTELMGKDAFEDWFASAGEKAAMKAVEEVDNARRIAEEKAGMTFAKVFGEEETFS